MGGGNGKGTARAPKPRRLLDQIRDALRRRHYSLRTEQSYGHWIARFVFFSDKRHPKDLGAPKVTAFLSQLARDRDVASGHGDVELPDAIARKYPRAPYEWGWKFVFPSHKLSVDPRSGVIRRHHVFENYLIRGVDSPLDAFQH